jgi:hypothetical protein
MNFSELNICVQRAIDTLYARDHKLFELNETEWALSHRLAVYLEQEIPGWNVDCEYHRQGQNFDLKMNAQTDGPTHNTRPDIILHHRGELSREHNLLVAELKKAAETDDDKTKEFTRPPTVERKFQYQYGLALTFLPQLNARWYENGRKIDIQ